MKLSSLTTPIAKRERYSPRQKKKIAISPEQEYARYIALHPEEFVHLSEDQFLAHMAKKFGHIKGAGRL